MLQFEELKLRLENIGPDIEELAGALGLAQAKRESAELDQKAAMDGFWDNMETAQAVTQRNAQSQNRRVRPVGRRLSRRHRAH